MYKFKGFNTFILTTKYDLLSVVHPVFRMGKYHKQSHFVKRSNATCLLSNIQTQSDTVNKLLSSFKLN